MTNYDMDELRRRGEIPDDYVNSADVEKRREFAKDIIENEKSEAEVTVELPDEVVLKLALQAHERDITLNKMCHIVLRDSLKDLEYRYEHQSKPQVLKEY